jgi:hypothetical protein
VSENRVLRKMFVPEGEEVRGKWGKLFQETIHDLYSNNIIRGMKSKRIRRAVVRMGKKIYIYI